MKPRELHRIGTAGMLACLGGFVDEPRTHSRDRFRRYTEADVELMASFYRRFSRNGRLGYGRAKELAQWLDRDRLSLRVTMSNLRKRGALPSLRGSA